MSLFMALLAALLAREIRELIRAVLRDDAVAAGAAWVVALGPPLIHYAGLVFTEVPAALVVAVTLRQAVRGRGWGVGRAVFVGLLLGFLPWLNVRYVLVAVVVGLYALWQGPEAPGRGLVDRARADLRRRSRALPSRPLRLLRPSARLRPPPGVLPRHDARGPSRPVLDQEFGLLVYAPVFALVPVRRLSSCGGAIAGPAVVVVTGVALTTFTAATWHMWRGGFNPPARFLVPVLPLLAIAAGRRPSGARHRGRRPAHRLHGVGGRYRARREPRLVHRDRDGTAPFWRAAAGAEEWTRLLPGYVLADADRRALALVWAVALGAAVSSRKRPTAGSMALATAGLLGAVGARPLLSHGRTEGRDAVHVIGRPALRGPGVARRPPAPTGEWGPESLDWGPLFEPHRHPAGAPLGSRLALAPGSYRVAVLGDDLAPGALPFLDVWPEAGPGIAREEVEPLPAGVGRRSGGLRGRRGRTGGDVAPRGGGPRLLRRVVARGSTLRGGTGLIRGGRRRQ